MRAAARPRATSRPWSNLDVRSIRNLAMNPTPSPATMATAPPGIAHRLRRFGRWWLWTLSTLLPQRWRRASTIDPAGSLQLWVLSPPQAPSLELNLRVDEGGAARVLASFTLSAHDDPQPLREALAEQTRPAARHERPGLLIVLPNERVLCRRLVLPLAVEDDLDAVLTYQMAQLTPFEADQVYFGRRIVARDFAREHIEVELCITPRAGIEPLLAHLGQAGLVVRAMLAERDLGADHPLDLLPPQWRVKRPSWRRDWLPWLGLSVFLLAAAALSFPIVVKRQAAIELLPWLDKARRAAEATDALRREVDALVEARNLLPNKKRERPAVLVSLEELTRVLPDDTWAQQVDIKGYEVQIQGETGSASRLIALFEQSALFANASFRSPLTKGAAPGSERYQLGVEIRRPLTGASAPLQPSASGPGAPAAASSPASAGVQSP